MILKFTLLYNADAFSVLLGYKHSANSGWHSRYAISTDNSFHACRSDVISTDNSFVHEGMTSFCKQVVYKFIRRCVFYFHWRNLIFKKLLDLQLHNKTNYEIWFSHDSEIVKASVCVVRLSLRLRQIAQPHPIIVYCYHT